MGQRPHVGQPSDAACAAAGFSARARFTTCAWVGCAAVAGTLLVGCGNGSGSAITRITQATDAQIVTAAGQTQAARAGLTLHAGDEVRTGADGAVGLATGDRRSYLGGQGSYVVRGRGAGDLQRGAFVVDGRKGSGLEVTTGTVTARIGRSVVRIEHGFAVRVGVLAGRAVTVTGDASNAPAQLNLAPLYQVVVAGRGLAGSTPLTLVDDDAERLVVPDLVGDDIQLNRTAAALDTGTEGQTIVRLAAADGVRATAAPRHAVSEAALPMAMARAVTASLSDRVALQARFAQAAKLRAQGGSWAVVARLIGTDATATGRAINALLTGVPSAGTVLAVAPFAPTTGSNGSNGNTTSRPRSSTGNDRSNDGNGNGSNPPSGNPTPSPSPSPSPTPGTVEQVVDGILGLVPSSPAPSKTQPTQDSCKILGLIKC